MCCKNNEHDKVCSTVNESYKKCCNNSMDYLIVLVLYILLIIIVGSCIF